MMPAMPYQLLTRNCTKLILFIDCRMLLNSPNSRHVLTCVVTGARVQTSSVLLSLAELNDASNAVSAAHQKLQQVDKELEAVKPVAAK